ncbi:MAG: hypothetical protein PUC24_01740 [Oscillospiraceae bacterium]|nr:hypothetical protein [Oscillospiraceae bacterium]
MPPSARRRGAAGQRNEKEKQEKKTPAGVFFAILRHAEGKGARLPESGTLNRQVVKHAGNTKKLTGISASLQILA